MTTEVKFYDAGAWCRLSVTLEDSEISINLSEWDYIEEEWEHEAEWVFGVEEYTDGKWLPYWETFGGDSSMLRLEAYWPRIEKMWRKLGYKAEVDDERPIALENMRGYQELIDKAASQMQEGLRSLELANLFKPESTLDKKAKEQAGVALSAVGDIISTFK